MSTTKWPLASARWTVRGLLGVVVGVLVVAAGMPPAQATTADKRNDYNRDNFTDAVAVNPADGCLYEVGGPGFYRLIGCGWNPYRRSIAATGDVNGDGNGDLYAISDTDNCIYRWLGNGNGGFGAGTKLNCSGWGAYAGGLTGAGDLNNDGRGDLVGINSGNGCLYRWYGTATGYGSGQQVGCGWGPFRGRLTGIGDINSDGNADLVGLNTNTDCLLGWLGRGNGNFNPAYQVSCHQMSGYDFAGGLSGQGDWSGDEAGDLIAINVTQGCLYHWPGNGAGHFLTPYTLFCDSQIASYWMAM